MGDYLFRVCGSHFGLAQLLATSPKTTAPKATVDISASDWTKGAKEPKLTLIEYSDFQSYKDPDTSAYEEKDRIINEFKKLPKDKDIIVYCYSIPCMTGRKVGKGNFPLRVGKVS